MARALRVDVPGGWYHVTSRGTERRVIFDGEREYLHFLDLLGELPGRFRVLVHAYVLMPNHYHLLIQTPDANASRAMQWLNVSYGVWYNRKHGRVGPLFQGRFKATLVDGAGAWALEASRYLHLNPARIRALELDKRNVVAERRGRSRLPTKEEVTRRLAALRDYRWSSYRAYAGYRLREAWLTTEELLHRTGGRNPHRKYRAYVEAILRQGFAGDTWSELREKWSLGSAEFRTWLKANAKGNRREQPALRHLRPRVDFRDVVRAVAAWKGESWESFQERHGDSGRDIVLAVARRCCGLTLAELGTAAGGMNYWSVSEAIRRIERTRTEDTTLDRLLRTLTFSLLNIET